MRTDDAAILRSMEPILKVSDTRKNGMNWLIESIGGEEVIWHNGETGGFKSYLGMTQDDKGVFIVTNSTMDVSEIALKLLLEID